MNNFMSGVYAGLFVSIFASVLVLIYIAAKNDIFFTFVEEGTAKAVKRFGQFKKIVMAYKDHELGKHGTVVKGKKYHLGGLRWVGVPFINTVHRYNFRWISLEQKEENGKIVVKPVYTEKPINYILIRDDVYYTVATGLAKKLETVDIVLLLTVSIVNPYKALFKIQNWLETVQNRVVPVVRSFISTQELEALIGKKEEMGDKTDTILQSSKIYEDLEGEYGVRLKKLGFESVTLSGSRAEILQTASTKQFEAEQEAKRIATIAAAEVGRVNQTYAAVQQYGETGLFMKAMEAVQETGKGPSNLVLFPLGAIKDLISGLVGKKPDETKKEEGK